MPDQTGVQAAGGRTDRGQPPAGEASAEVRPDGYDEAPSGAHAAAAAGHEEAPGDATADERAAVPARTQEDEGGAG
jgi:hypothetical protein